jgi:ankyrin repeat protein
MKNGRRAKLGRHLVATAILILGILALSGCNRADDPLLRAMAAGDTQAVEKILKSNPSLANKRLRFGQETPLSYAVSCEHSKEMIDLLVAHGADINAKSGGFDITPLQHAVRVGRVEAVRALLANKPDVNAVNSENRTAMHYGISVYMRAAFAGDTNNVGQEIMELLLANGADINHGYPILIDASHYAKNTGLIAFLLSKGASVNVRESHRGETALELAIGSGNKDATELILGQNPQLTLRGGNCGTALATAVGGNHLDMALLIHQHVLLGRSNSVAFAAGRSTADVLRTSLEKQPQNVDERDELGFTPLHHAAAAGRKDNAELLLAAGAEINAADGIGLHPLEWAAFAGRFEVVEFLVEKGGYDLHTALFLAAQQGQNNIVEFLLEHGASPDAHYNGTVTALHVAAQQGNPDLARLLLKHGAHPNFVEHNRWTPLDYAVGQSSKEMVELLFAHGAIIPPKPPGYWSIFHEWALGAGDTNIAELLLSRKADVNAKGSDGQRPLHFAARQGQLHAVEWLLRHGAEVNARDGNGKTPLGMLYGRRGRVTRKDVAELLQRFGAKQ